MRIGESSSETRPPLTRAFTKSFSEPCSVSGKLLFASCARWRANQVDASDWNFCTLRITTSSIINNAERSLATDTKRICSGKDSSNLSRKNLFGFATSRPCIACSNSRKICDIAKCCAPCVKCGLNKVRTSAEISRIAAFAPSCITSTSEPYDARKYENICNSNPRSPILSFISRSTRASPILIDMNLS